MSLKIAIFVNSFPNLSETFILNQITGLIDKGYHVDIYSMKRGNLKKVHSEVLTYSLLDRTRYLGDIPRNYIVRCLKAIALLAANLRWLRFSALMRSLDIRRYGTAASSLSLLYAIVPLMRGTQYDIIHCQFGTLGPKVLLFRQLGAISGRLVTSFRGYDATQYMHKRPGVYDELFREADLILTVSNSLKKVLIEAGCPEARIRVHHSGIDCTRLNFSGRRRANGEPLKVLTVARLVEKKGIVFALRAIAGMLTAGRQVIYTIIGDGPLRDQLQREIDELDLGSNVKLTGWKVHDEVLDIMRESHVLVAPSITTEKGDQEGIPNAAKEAMALGMPVIGTLHGGIPELIKDKVTGFLVPEGDAEALIDRLTFVMDNPGVWAELGRNAREYVISYFDIHELNERALHIYRNLVNGIPEGCPHKATPTVSHTVTGNRPKEELMEKANGINITWHQATVTRERREMQNGHRSFILWFTGLSGSGKSTLAHALEERLHQIGCRTFVFDGDNVRHGLNKDLTFSPEDRQENIRRIGEMCRLFMDAGVIALTAFISPFRQDRAMVRQLAGEGNFVEIFCACSLATCETRDVKGLYAKARRGEIKDFTGISSPYEEPEDPELFISTDSSTVEECVHIIIQYLKHRRIIECAAGEAVVS